MIGSLDQICDALGDLFPGGPLACKILVQVQLPQIIEDLVNTPPEEICASLGACPAVPTTTTPPMTSTTPETTTQWWTTATSEQPTITTTMPPSTTEWKTTPTEPPMTDTTTLEPDTTTWMDTTTTSKSKAVYKLLRH